jgi:hypothetical protein
MAWYAAMSGTRGLSPRCLFASVHRCPRCYRSAALLRQCGVAAAITEEEDRELKDRWRRSDLGPVVDEQATALYGAEHDPHIFSRFCPEAAFARVA